MTKWRVTINNDIVEFDSVESASIFRDASDGILTENNEVEVTEDKTTIQDKLIEACWAFITPYFDNASFIQILDWKNSFPNDHEIQPYIKAIEDWKSSVMFEYLMIKKSLLYAGLPYDFEYAFVGSPPCKFTDLFLLANPTLQAYAPNWVAPDITNYQPGSRQNPKAIAF